MQRVHVAQTSKALMELWKEFSTATRWSSDLCVLRDGPPYMLLLRIWLTQPHINIALQRKMVHLISSSVWFHHWVDHTNKPSSKANNELSLATAVLNGWLFRCPAGKMVIRELLGKYMYHEWLTTSVHQIHNPSTWGFGDILCWVLRTAGWLFGKRCCRKHYYRQSIFYRSNCLHTFAQVVYDAAVSRNDLELPRTVELSGLDGLGPDLIRAMSQLLPVMYLPCHVVSQAVLLGRKVTSRTAKNQKLENWKIGTKVVN